MPGMRVRGDSEYHAVNAQALPYPGLATDLQPQLAAFLTQANGASTIHERVYDNRLLYIGELRKMGANVSPPARRRSSRARRSCTAAPRLGP